RRQVNAKRDLLPARRCWSILSAMLELEQPKRTDPRRVQTICLLILTFIASAVALYLLKPVLVPFVLALFFTYCLAPLIDVQMKHFRAPRGVAVVCASIFGLAVLGLAGFVVATAIGKISQNFPDYETQFAKLTK